MSLRATAKQSRAGKRSFGADCFGARRAPRNDGSVVLGECDKEKETSAWIYRFGPAALALAGFLAMSGLYRNGPREIYDEILRAWGIVPFQTPFLDLSGNFLAPWECLRRGVDVFAANPCDLLHRAYVYSPLGLAAARLPLGVADTTAVGWGLDLIFVLSLTLLPPPRNPLDLVLVTAASLSTMVVFALERANPDILLFLLALAAGLLAECGLAARMIAYGLTLVAALLKYYPAVVFIILFRERPVVFAAVAAAAAVSLAGFFAGWHADIMRGLANMPPGPYNTDLFAAKNLPFLVGLIVEDAAAPHANATAAKWMVTAGLYAGLAGAALAICRRLLRLPGWCAGIAALSGRERMLLVIGSAVIAGCFFAGQSIGYRGIFLLLVLPGLLGLSRGGAGGLRILCLGTAVVIVLLMWGEALRRALDGGFGFWLVRELGWWWSVSVMLAVLGDFVREAPVWRGAGARLGRAPAAAR